MARQLNEKVEEILQKEGFDAEQSRKIGSAIRSILPGPVYNKAVVFLGWATVVLALGSILLAGVEREVPEALWGALGAGIGGLAGIFMGKE
jgi:hypothetical protein